jgi:hypothetical protein
LVLSAILIAGSMLLAAGHSQRSATGLADTE